MSAWLRLLRRPPSDLPAAEDEVDEAARWARITELVDGALRRPDASDRARWLREACGGDRDLRIEVERLLRFENDTGGLLDHPLWDRDDTSPTEDATEATDPTEIVPVPTSAPRPGQRIGPYRIKRWLGAGGMGVVALAHDPSLERSVALKLIRRGQVSNELRRRFAVERRLLARLDHPAIARIYDSGEHEGLPYFTMEAIDGLPIDEFCDHHRLSITRRLALVERVAEALAEAHRSLVVHRDLKPRNILITKAGEPKLLDFGIAKDLEPSGVAQLTGIGPQPMTPAYASPEQMRGLPVTVATDLYSLGVVLYRLLCGHPPHLLDGDALDKLRQVCEVEPPPPSSRTSLTHEVWFLGQPSQVSPDELAKLRGCEPRQLRRRLRGDLDSIVLQLLAKDPRHRYRSMDDLVEDLRRHRRGLPVAARRHTVAYRAGKFVRRHRWRLAAAMVVLASLALGAGAWQRGRQQVAAMRLAELEAEADAARAESEAAALASFARSMVRAAEPDERGGQPVGPDLLLERALASAQEDLATQPELLAHQLEAIGLAHRSLGDQRAAVPLLTAALRLRRRVYGRDHPLIARGLNNLAAAHHGLGNRQLAEFLYGRALAMKRRLGQEGEALSRIESNLASLLMFRGELDAAEDLYRRILATRKQADGDGSINVARTLRSLGQTLYLRGDLEGAEIALLEALKQHNAAGDEGSVALASVLGALSRVHHAQGRLEEAEAVAVRALVLRRDLLPASHPHLAASRLDLAYLYDDLSEVDAAEALRALAMPRMGNSPWRLAEAESRLGQRLAARGQHQTARVCLEDAYEKLREIRGENAFPTRQARQRFRTLSRESQLELAGGS